MSKFPDFSEMEFEVVDAELTPEQEMQAAKTVDEVLPKFRQRAGLVPGGKSLSGGATKSPTVQTVLAESSKAELEAEAAELGMSVSKLTRRILEEHLAARR